MKKILVMSLVLVVLNCSYVFGMQIVNKSNDKLIAYTSKKIPTLSMIRDNITIMSGTVYKKRLKAVDMIDRGNNVVELLVSG